MANEKLLLLHHADSHQETILSKKGPLARVWLAAHWEKKLTKANIVSTNIQSAAEEIRDENHAPMALRLSGQLLLGVVKIYSRKARYLLEDCNDALLKIKMAFRPGNVDLSSATVRSAQAQAATLLMPDTLTELDLLMPDPNFNLDLDFDFNAPPSTANISRRQDITLDRSLEFPRGNVSLLELEEEDDPLAGGVDLDLDIGEDEGPSVELGRRAASEMPEDLAQSYQDLDQTFDKAPSIAGDVSAGPEFILEDAPVFQGDLDLPTTPRGDSMLLDRDGTPRAEDMEVDLAGAEQETPRPARQAPRKRRIVEDTATEISSKVVSANLRDTSAIRKKQRFLSADPVLLNLQQKSLTGGFAGDVFAPMNLNPTIRSLLAPEFLRRMAELRAKRKRTDSEEDSDGNAAKEARIGDQDLGDVQLEPLSELDLPDMSLPPIPEDDSQLPILETEDMQLRSEGVTGPEYATLEPPQSSSIETPETTETQTQPTSIDTREAVLQIRDTLDDASDGTTVFSTLASGASKAKASELFFQVLLLATKDAIRVDQSSAYGEIQIQSRPALAAISFESQSQAVA